jgi:hypothetical protein
MKKVSRTKSMDALQLALLGGLVYGTYKVIGMVAKADKGDVDDMDVPNVPATAPYEDKVKALQTALKVTPDGIVGKITNGALENLYAKDGSVKSADLSLSQNYINLRTNGKGQVSPNNIDYYLNALSRNDYPSYYYNKTKRIGITAQNIRDAYAKGGVLKVKQPKYPFNVVVYDNARQSYVHTGKVFTYKPFTAFVVPEITSRGLVKIMDITKAGNLIIKISTITSTTLLSVNADDVYVD